LPIGRCGCAGAWCCAGNGTWHQHPGQDHMCPARGLYSHNWLRQGRLAPSAAAVGVLRLPSQVVGQGLGDMPFEPELRFAPRLTWPRIPGHAARTGTAYSGRPLRCPFFHQQMRGGAAVAAGVGGCCLHESTPPQRAWLGALVLLSSRQVQTAARHNREILLKRAARTGGCRRRSRRPWFGGPLRLSPGRAPA
jgi:hypothetical protein